MTAKQRARIEKDMKAAERRAARLNDLSYVEEEGIVLFPSAQQPEAGSIIFCGYWRSVEEIIAVDGDVITCRTIGSINGRVKRLAQPEPVRQHSTRWERSRDLQIVGW